MLKNLFRISICITVLAVATSQTQWWETASFYQIYPRSYQDSDGDGVGDLKGISDRLAFLKEIGITATWLSPVFTSPMADFGYDIADFMDIAPIFGTMEDMEALLEESKRIGVKVILDLVPNHSSDECEWFIKSAARDPEYEDFYVWHPGKMVDGERVPPTNWISVFRGSAWTFHETRGEYYLHQFHRKQPDLNYRNPKVVETMKEVIRFWLRKGVAGFRVDAVPHVFEVEPDSDNNYPDEPVNPNSNDPLDYDYLQHIHTTNKPETTELILEFRTVVDEVQAELGSEDELILMIEAYAPRDIVNSFYGNETVKGAQIPFNFDLISNLKSDSSADYYESLINNYLQSLPEGKAPNWVLGNHDQSRVGSRLGADRIDMMNILLKTLPGVSVTYQGEEIGMTDVWISWEDTVDPQACQSNPEEFERLTRDPVRTPFQWNSNKLAGFTTGDTTWLPVADNFPQINVQKERGIALSHLNVYKRLQLLREEPVFRFGRTEVKALNANVLLIKRYLSPFKTHITLLNIQGNTEVINLHNSFSDLANQLQVVLVTDKSYRRTGDLVKTDSVVLLPREAIILRNI